MTEREAVEIGLDANQKEDWLDIIRQDNSRMVDVIKNVKESKARFLRAVEGVEQERNALRALQTDIVDSKINKEMANGLLSEHKRILLPANLRSEAKSVHLQLELLSTKIRANQLEILQRTLKIVKETEEAFVGRQPDEVEAKIDELRNLAAATPCNLLTADAMIKDLPKTIMEALHGQYRKSMETYANDEALQLDPSDVSSIARQNEHLRAQCEQLKRKNVQMRNKLLKANDAAARAMEASMGEITDASLRTLRNEMLRNKNVKTQMQFQSLDTDLATEYSEIMLEELQTIVNDHPLAVGQPPWVLNMVIMEVKTFIEDLVVTFVSDLTPPDISENKFDWLKNSIGRYFKSASGYSETQSKIMLVLSYIQQRLKSIGAHGANAPEFREARVKAAESARIGVKFNVSGSESNSGSPIGKIPSTGREMFSASELLTTEDEQRELTLDPEMHKPKESNNVPRYMSHYKGRASMMRK
jgi:hypothetical protein